MPEPPASEPPFPGSPEDALISPPKVEAPTQSSLSPQEQTNSGGIKPAEPFGAVVGVGSHVGPYLLLEKLGEGGMGAVYKARHTRLDKLVALKILSQHVLSHPDALTRFDREMKAVGKLQHPNVVQAHDAGEFAGVHYLSMEYVEGQDLSALLKAQGLMSVVNACQAIRQAALGLAAAHKLGLVHRDIKPSNLFATKDTGQIKILDMGLALLQHEETGALTSSGQCFGTPDYMAPEQWDDAHTCDGRADLYSLGCTLFVLLTGRPPYSGDEYRSTPRKMMGHVRDPFPDLIAARTAALARKSSDPKSLVLKSESGTRTTDKSVHPPGEIPAELDAIYRKLMAKQPEDRFRSADDLVKALMPLVCPSSPVAPRQESRSISDSPKRLDSVTAEDPSNALLAAAIVSRNETATLEQPVVDPLAPTLLWKSASKGAASTQNAAGSPRGSNRNRLLAAAGVAAFVTLSMIVIIIANTNVTNPRDATKIEIETDASSEISNLKSQISNPIDPVNVQLTHLAKPRVVDLTGLRLLNPGQPMSVHALVPRPATIPGLRSWSVELAGSHVQTASALATTADGNWIATAGHGMGKISLWDRDGHFQRGFLGHEGDIVSLDFSRDGRWLASCEQVRGERGSIVGATARIWNVQTGGLHALIPIPGRGERVTFSTDGDRLAVSLNSNTGSVPSFLICELASGDNRPAPDRVGGHGLAWSPDASEIACSHVDLRLRIWDTKTLKMLRETDAPASPLEWSPDGRWLAMRSGEGKVQIRDANTLTVAQTFGLSESGYAHSLKWLPDSKRIAVAAESALNSVFDAITGKESARFDRSGKTVAVFDDGKQVVCESGGRLHFYDTSSGQKIREGTELGKAGGSAVLAANGREVFCQNGSQVLIHDAATGQRLRSFPQLLAADSFSEPSPDGTLLGIVAKYGLPTMQIVDAQTGATRQELSHGGGDVTRAAWSSDGKWLATGATDNRVRVWNVATEKIEHELAGHTGTIWCLVWSPDGTRLASAAEDKTIRLWDPGTGELVATYDTFPEAIHIGRRDTGKLTWDANNRQLWIGLTNHIAPLDIHNGTIGPLENFSNGNVVAFLNASPDGQQLLAREAYGWTFVRGKEAQDRRLIGQWLGDSLQWHPDNRRFLGWEPDYGAVSFDVETNRRLGMLFPWLTGDHWLCIGPTGHYCGSPGVEEQIVFIAMHDDGSQRTHTAAEFAAQFGWKNEPENGTLLKLQQEK